MRAGDGIGLYYRYSVSALSVVEEERVVYCTARRAGLLDPDAGDSSRPAWTCCSCNPLQGWNVARPDLSNISHVRFPNIRPVDIFIPAMCSAAMPHFIIMIETAGLAAMTRAVSGVQKEPPGPQN